MEGKLDLDAIHQSIAETILLIRGQRVMLDAHLALLYEVETKVLNQAVKRNADRFPEDFRFQLTAEEKESLRSQFVTLDVGRGHYTKYLPFVFTEQGVAMLSSVLHSERAIAVNIEIMRTFVRFRRMLASNDELALKLDSLERRYDGQFKIVFDTIKAMVAPPELHRKRPIGFSAWE